MAGRTLPGLGLKGDWALGEDNWKDENDLNLLALSVLTQGRFLSFEAATPGAPAEGAVYIFTDAHPTHPEQIAVYDEATWKYFLPTAGMIMWNVGDSKRYEYKGGAWVELTSGGGGGGGPAVEGQAWYRRSANVNDVTGDGTAYVLPYDTVVAGQSWATLNAANGEVTITQAGFYFIMNKVALTGGSGLADWAFIGIDRNGSSILSNGMEFTDEPWVRGMVQAMYYLNAGDVIRGTVTVGGTTKTYDMQSGFDCEFRVARFANNGIGGGSLAWKGALATLAAQATGVNYSSEAAVPWTAEAYDIGGWHDNAVNNTRLTVPAGVTKIRVGFMIQALNVTAGTDIFARIRKNGGTAFAGVPLRDEDVSHTVPRFGAWSPVLEVAPGDYFELLFSTGGDASIDISTDSWFAIEAVEGVPTSTAKGVVLAGGATQTIPTGTDTLVTMGVKGVDDFAVTVPLTQVVAPNTGWYSISGQVSWASNATFANIYKYCRILINGVIQMEVLDTDQRQPTQNAVANRYLNAGDTISLQVRHTQGANLDVLASRLQIIKMA